MLNNAFKHATSHQHALIPFGLRRWVSWWLKNASLVHPVCDRDISKRLTAHTDRTSFQVVGSPVAASIPLAPPHFATPHQVRAVPLSPFALRLVFPVLLAGRHSCDYYGDSVPMR